MKRMRILNPKKNNKEDLNKSSNDFLNNIDLVNKVIHQPIRLQIISLLMVVEHVDMLYLKKQFQITWGNLSTHVSKLESAGYLTMTKAIVEKRTYTTLAITQAGRKDFEVYRNKMKSILNFS